VTARQKAAPADTYRVLDAAHRRGLVSERHVWLVPTADLADPKRRVHQERRRGARLCERRRD
jgi:hypothetical protein